MDCNYQSTIAGNEPAAGAVFVRLSDFPIFRPEDCPLVL